VSVVVRSYRRLDACCELIDIIFGQDYTPFEVVVVEQTPDPTPAQAAALAAREARYGDALRVLRTPALGPAGARNAGWQAARYPIVLFMDDDDLPLGASWIARHAARFAEPGVVGVSGREVLAPGERCGYRRRVARRYCLHYNWLGHPHTYCRFDEAVDPVHWLHGGNASIRREAIERAGGWDAAFFDHEEHSFAFRLQKVLRPGERLIFDPTPLMLRRKDVLGGLGRRQATVRETFDRYFDYFARVVAPHRPWRVRLLAPVYGVWITGVSVRWIWKDSQRHRGFIHRLLASLGTILVAPAWLVFGLVRTPR
jgi:glycosyltransferase involved in cell wall biosynthesis